MNRRRFWGSQSLGTHRRRGRKPISPQTEPGGPVRFERKGPFGRRMLVPREIRLGNMQPENTIATHLPRGKRVAVTTVVAICPSRANPLRTLHHCPHSVNRECPCCHDCSVPDACQSSLASRFGKRVILLRVQGGLVGAGAPVDVVQGAGIWQRSWFPRAVLRSPQGGCISMSR